MVTVLNALLKDLEGAYQASDIRQYCMAHGYQWFYSLVTTTLKTAGPMVIGFNWGVSRDEKYEPQIAIVKSDFSKEDVGSLSRIFPYCEKYFGIDFLSRITQSNYCFFRSKYESQISNKDIQLCEPIFEKLITIINPSSIICFSSKLRDYMFRSGKIASIFSKKITFSRGSSLITFECMKATLISGIEICFLPHPNYPMKGTAREEAWNFCYGQG